MSPLFSPDRISPLTGDSLSRKTFYLMHLILYVFLCSTVLLLRQYLMSARGLIRGTGAIHSAHAGWRRGRAAPISLALGKRGSGSLWFGDFRRGLGIARWWRSGNGARAMALRQWRKGRDKASVDASCLQRAGRCVMASVVDGASAGMAAPRLWVVYAYRPALPEPLKQLVINLYQGATRTELIATNKRRSWAPNTQSANHMDIRQAALIQFSQPLGMAHKFVVFRPPPQKLHSQRHMPDRDQRQAHRGNAQKASIDR